MARSVCIPIKKKVIKRRRFSYQRSNQVILELSVLLMKKMSYVMWMVDKINLGGAILVLLVSVFDLLPWRRQRMKIIICSSTITVGNISLPIRFVYKYNFRNTNIGFSGICNTVLNMHRFDKRGFVDGFRNCHSRRLCWYS